MRIINYGYLQEHPVPVNETNIKYRVPYSNAQQNPMKKENAMHASPQ